MDKYWSLIMFRNIWVLLLFVVLLPSAVLAQAINERLESQSNWDSATKLSLNNPIPKSPPTQAQCVDPDNIPLNGFGPVGCWNFKVGSVIDDKTMLINVGKYTYWMEGYDTKPLATGQSIRIVDPVYFVGMKDYTTVLGSSIRVRHLKVLTKAQQLADDLAKREDARAKLEANAEVWIVDGKEIKGRFVAYRDSLVILETIENGIQKIRLSKFDPTSAAKIRELRKLTETQKKK